LLNAAVIGAGLAGFHHCRAYFKADNSKLVAVSDSLDDRLKQVKSEFGNVDTYKDYGELLKRDDIDIVSIATPNFTHARIALEAIESGKNVFLEKPMALTLERCDQIIEAAERNNVKITIDYEGRLNPLFAEIKEHIDKGEVGKVASVAIFHWRGPFGIKPGGWTQQSKYAGNIFFEQVIHWFDILRWYGGEIKQIHCLANDWVREEFDFAQTAFINLTYESGAVGQIAQTINGFWVEEGLWVIGTKAAITAGFVYHPTGNSGFIRFKPHQEDITSDKRPDIVRTKIFGSNEIFEFDVMERHVQDFVNRVEKGLDPIVKGIDGRKTVELALAAEESAMEKKLVMLPLERSPDFALKRERAKQGFDNTIII